MIWHSLFSRTACYDLHLLINVLTRAPSANIDVRHISRSREMRLPALFVFAGQVFWSSDAHRLDVLLILD